MVQFIREIYPVGQGGFAFESIGGYNVVFDCGSTTSSARVLQFINRIHTSVGGKIDRLYLSHFDKDHVNSIEDLIRIVGVKEAVIPFVPKKHRDAYNIATGGAYFSIRSILSNQENGIRLIEPEEEETKRNTIWEWISKPLLTEDDWKLLADWFKTKGIVESQLSDPKYVAAKREQIKDCYDKAFNRRINSKGLILLSQNVGGVVRSNIMIYKGQTSNLHGTAALYLGDADAKTKKRKKAISDFLNNHLSPPLVFIQIPHHGSKENSNESFKQTFSSSFYFYHDKSSARLMKNTVLFSNLLAAGVLLDVTDVDPEMIEHLVEIH